MTSLSQRSWVRMGAILAMVVGSMGASCSGKGKTEEVRQTPRMPDYKPVKRPKPDARVLLITDLKGYLEPCGCTSRPLGGIDRMAAKIDALKQDGVPTFTVFAGPTFVGGEAPKGVDPALAKSQLAMTSKTLSAVLKLYADALLTAPEDQPWEPSDAAASSVGVLPQQTAQGCMPPNCKTWAGPEMVFHGSKADGEQPTASASNGPLTFGLALGSRRAAATMARSKAYDFVILAGIGAHPPEPPNTASGAPIINAGRQGQGLVQLDLYLRDAKSPFTDWSDWSLQIERERKFERIKELNQRIVEWSSDSNVDKANLARQESRLQAMQKELEAMQPAAKVEGNAFVATHHELPPEAPKATPISKILDTHFKRVNETNKQLYAALKPKPVSEGQPSYTGSAACASCHKQAYQWWRGHAHGRAYQTLVDLNKEYNLACVGCHVTGYMEPGGSTVTHNLDGKLVDVGCESCHGPGSAHNAAPEANKLVTVTPETTCISCHNEEHSDKFDYRVYSAMLRAPGHGSPPSP